MCLSMTIQRTHEFSFSNIKMRLFLTSASSVKELIKKMRTVTSIEKAHNVGFKTDVIAK